ncbi:hypothetical protein N7513_003736 [Penicillium frequentans]|nr:hypothetical protein N7513_003736 [Penicillium glabrum]
MMGPEDPKLYSSHQNFYTPQMLLIITFRLSTTLNRSLLQKRDDRAGQTAPYEQFGTKVTFAGRELGPIPSPCTAPTVQMKPRT